MGMYDYIKKEECKDIPCPYCGNRELEFQTKDTDCELCEVSIKNVDRFYDRCEKCDSWVEFERVNDEEEMDTEDYLKKHFSN